VSVALKKIEGVESAQVRLNEGKAIIQLKPKNGVRMEQIRKAVSEQGFTPKEARVEAIGDLLITNGQMQFRVTGSNDVFPVEPAPHAAWWERAERNLLVTGIVAAPREAKELGVIQVLQVSKESPTPIQE
jgi:copper chaperone CopZ